ncbi:carbohydrate deacetylase [Chloroflexota bacterium]
MTKRLIVNADDYCRTPGVSKGIREAHLNGIVTSTSCMMNMTAAEEDIELLLREAPGLQMGVHLVLTSAPPLLPIDKVRTLVDEYGKFFTYEPFLDHLELIDSDEVLAEWIAQIEKFISVSGKKPTHLDSHHHSSYFYEPFFERMLQLAQDLGCPIRYPVEQSGDELAGMPPKVFDDVKEFLPRMHKQTSIKAPDNFISSFYDLTATHEELDSILEGLPDNTSELMCHPGYADEQIISGSIYARQRQRELDILTSQKAKDQVRKLEIELISFEDL